ncbi:DNA polymerase III subunit delta [Treponema sp.]|uniref:DNA polymerase III subunit delta n=1 Tax=Treponema sp. TaxID=166 RepID=UPI00298EC17F|nr:DNA polymerase III subunit delta [Treponema sp.]MCI6443180.1 DNA polymerase III subunit delta [Spirochaetia bacterium]MDY4132903.1 DNA polymerase III subunit delta [Treponema sp.]
MASREFYVFTGPEAGEKNDAIANIREQAKKRNGDISEYRYYASDIRVADLVAQLQNGSLFEPALFITVRNAEIIKSRGDVELLTGWIKSSAESPNTLILVSDENGIDKKLEAACAGDHKKVFWEMFENRKSQWVESFFRKNGFSVTSDAVEQILEMIENNTDALRSECSRFFFCFEKGHTVTCEDVDKILSHNREENAFTLFDAMADGSKNPSQRFETSMDILEKIKAASKSGYLIALIAGLTYCFRQLRGWHSIHANGARPTDVQLKTAGFSGKKKQEQYDRAAKVWNNGATSSILALLSHTDQFLRETPGLDENIMAMCLYSIVMKNGLFPAVYETDV